MRFSKRLIFLKLAYYFQRSLKFCKIIIFSVIWLSLYSASFRIGENFFSIWNACLDRDKGFVYLELCNMALQILSRFCTFLSLTPIQMVKHQPPPPPPLPTVHEDFSIFFENSESLQKKRICNATVWNVYNGCKIDCICKHIYLLSVRNCTLAVNCQILRWKQHS